MFSVLFSCFNLQNSKCEKHSDVAQQNQSTPAAHQSPIIIFQRENNTIINNIYNSCNTHSTYLKELKPLFEINAETDYQSATTKIFIVPYIEFAILLGQYKHAVSNLLAKEIDLKENTNKISRLKCQKSLNGPTISEQLSILINQAYRSQSDLIALMDNDIYRANLLRQQLINLNNNCKIKRSVDDPDSLYKEYEGYFNPTMLVLKPSFVTSLVFQ